MLSVVEWFKSIQGEGYYTGRPAIFVRFAGCNLSCGECDTKYAWEVGTWYSAEELLDKVLKVHEHIRFLVLTGGEVMIQPLDDLGEFVCLLKDKGFYVAIETNGTKIINKMKIPVDWITVSPKTAIFQTWGNELKLLYNGTQDLLFYEQFQFDYFYLQPLVPGETKTLDLLVPGPAKDAYDLTARAVMENPKWRLSAQMHKLVGLR